MTNYTFDPAPQFAIPVAGTDLHFPVRRIFCVGRNYAAHAAEMGNVVDREAPFYFTKSPAAGMLSGQQPYPAGTGNYHHEIEYVLGLGPAGVFEYVGVGLDMTRRDLQAQAKDKRRSWDLGKDFEGAAVFGPLTKVEGGFPRDGLEIRLDVNGVRTQTGELTDMIWSPVEILSHLAGFYTLGAGDVIMTGTPSGVGPVVAGDHLHGEIDGLEPVTLEII